MGYRKPYDYNTIHHSLYMAGVELNSPRNDGFTQWAIKQDLYKIKWLLDAMLEESSTFVGEEEFLRDHDKAIVWRALQK